MRSGKLRAGVCLWISGADTTEHNGGKGKDTLDTLDTLEGEGYTLEPPL